MVLYPLSFSSFLYFYFLHYTNLALSPFTFSPPLLFLWGSVSRAQGVWYSISEAHHRISSYGPHSTLSFNQADNSSSTKLSLQLKLGPSKYSKTQGKVPVDILASGPVHCTAPTIGDWKLGSIWKKVIKSLIALTEVSSLRARLPIDGRLATRDSADRQRKSVR